MAAPITISSDASEESVTSIVSRVILFGTILTEILIVLDMPTELPTTPELPAVSPFLWIAISSPVFLFTPVIIASPAVRIRIRKTVRQRVLSPTRADHLPPRKRYRGTSAMNSDESSYEGSPVAQAELGIKPVLAGVETGFMLDLAVGDSKSEPEEAEANEEADVEVQLKDTIDIRVNVAIWIDILNNLLMPDAIERLG
nr:hypothetical protein [Tanacetum cinerariifolium]